MRFVRIIHEWHGASRAQTYASSAARMSSPAVAASSAEFRRRFVLFLLPGLYQSALPFLTLPLTTRVLGPADFALFSVANAISALLTTIAQLGSVFMLAQRFNASDEDGRRRLVSTIFFQCLALSVFFALLVFLMWPIVRSEWTVANGLTEEMVALVMVSMVGASLYTLVGTLAVFGHAPGYYSLITMVKATISVIVMLIALFVFQLEVVSLFLGVFAAGIVDLIGSGLILLPFLAWHFDREVARDCLLLGGWSSFAQLSMQGRQLLERSVLSSTAGLHDLGLFVHAQQYQNYAMLGARPIQQALAPVMLEEAREATGEFRRTDRAIRVLFGAITMLAISFALLGKEVIHIMTNGKFDEAAPYAALLIGVLLLQSAGRPQFARLLFEGRGRYLSVCNMVAVAGSAVFLVLLAPRYGLPAALAAIYLQYVLFRLAIELNAFWSGRLPFQDMRALAGIALVGTAVAVTQIWDPGFSVRVALLLAGLALTAVFNRSAIYDMIGQAQIVWSLRGGRTAAASVPADQYRDNERRES